MGSLKLEQHQKVERDNERGVQIQEVGSVKIEEAESSVTSLEQIQAIDDDDRAAVDAARSESNGIANAVSESEIREPGTDVKESLRETSRQSQEYSAMELQDASRAAEMTGDYSGTGAGLAGSLETSAAEFQDISDESDTMSGEMQAKFDQMSGILEGMF